ncbi:hypothetical protein GCM10009662_59720 [Catellatospora coxensis]|uniref:Uncharacterized protein n=1 Tax=Catellatospora coxensis TaxID=310354 RepID=A0A8J3KVL3_9ACTN|nr:hypothetical protein Cco03nite_37030 [Catellatospora coxensis]
MFARYPLAPGVEQRLRRPDTEPGLARTPLRELTAHQLDAHLFAGWRDEDDFSHFLPRVLELFATGEHRDGALLRKNLSEAHRPDRPADERAALHRYHLALWRQIRSAADPAFTAEDVLGACSLHDHDVLPYLADWAADPSPAAALLLARFIGGGRMPSWGGERYLGDIADWLGSAAPAAALTAALAATTDPAARRDLAYGLELLELDWQRDDPVMR